MPSSTEQLIESVKKYPILYDLGNSEYKNIRKRDKIWDEIGVELDESGEDVKKKWKNLRDSYAKYLKSKKTRTGQSAKKNYKNWQWAPFMEHFKPFLAFANTDTNVSEPVDVGENTEQLTNNTTVSESDYSQTVETEDTDIEDTTSDRTHIKNTTIPKPSQASQERVVASTSSSNQSARQKRRSSVKAEERSGSAVDTVIAYLEEKRKKKISPTDMIFMGYSETIQTFSPRRQAYVKMKIAEIMTEQECQHLEEVMGNNHHKSRPSSAATSYTSSSLLTPLDAGSSDNEYNNRPGTSTSNYSDMGAPPL
ncbi:hypothetical protein Zmor_006547 [Zophobas morio]|uniref:MADF domain-containing protein n=1 Tax=Zophobas morio TaxID=2755281 RepID=A0AA38IV24_9CUCU|nr:hypothetical protein Zmor_006547 [Zophobas morio]